MDHIIVLLLKGEPENVFPTELCYEGCWEEDELPDPDRETEIHWLDLKAGNFREAAEKLDQTLLMIAAPLLHCDPDDLIQRDRQWKRQKRMMWGMLGVTASAVALCVAYTFWLTWSVGYKRQAENALADGDDNKALFYYAKTLCPNPADEQARLNAQILLQKEAWPMAVREEKDSVILGNHIYPPKKRITCCLSALRREAALRFGRMGKNTIMFRIQTEFFTRNCLRKAVFFIITAKQSATHGVLSTTRSSIIPFTGRKKSARKSWYGKKISRENAIVYALQPGRIVVSNFESLVFFSLEEGVCQELCRIEMHEIFRGNQDILEEYGISLPEHYTYGIWPSPDGSQMVMTAGYWYSSDWESFCYSEAVLFDTETFQMAALEESGECLISNVSFQDDGEKLALIYNNKDGILENRGGASVYDCSGQLVFCTGCGSDMVP